MKQFTVHEAKTHLSRLIDMALEGEDVVIRRRKTPVVRLALVRDRPVRRTVGALPDLVIKMGDGFNDSIDDWSDEIEPSQEGNPAPKEPRP